MLATDQEAATWPQVPVDELHRGPQVRRPPQAIDGEYEIEVIPRESGIYFHWGLDQPNPRRERTERLLRESDLHW
jgi:hypothetical protein